MVYVVSGLNGHYGAFQKLVDKIHLKGADNLYIVGDIVGGKGSVKLLQNLACRVNVFPVLGDQDYIAQRILQDLKEMPVDGDYYDYLSDENEVLFDYWFRAGGKDVIEEFLALDADDREDILDYLAEFVLYEGIEVGDQEYVLVHGGLGDFDPEMPLDEYDIQTLVLSKTDYRKMYYEDKTLVTAHALASEQGADDSEPLIDNGHILLNISNFDKIVAVRLDDGEIFTMHI